MTSNQTILVVEDESAVRRWVAYCLTQRGYRVVEAADGGDALDALERAATPFALVLTDVRMPRLDGVALGRIVAERWPQVRVLYMSGYAGESVAAFQLAPTALPILQKPFTPDELSERVAAALAGQTIETSSDSPGACSAPPSA